MVQRRMILPEAIIEGPFFSLECWDKVLAVRHLILDVNDRMETAQYVHHWTMSFTATRNSALQGWENGNIDAAEAKDGTGECG